MAPKWLDRTIDRTLGRLGYQKARSRLPLFLSVEAEQADTMPFDGGFSAEQRRRLAMASPWVFSDIDLIASEVSAAHLNIMRRVGDEKEEVKDHPFVRLMERPNEFMARSYVMNYMTTWMWLDGEAYWFLAPNAIGTEIVEIWPLESRKVAPVPDKENFISHFQYTVSGRKYKIPIEHVCWFKRPNPFDQRAGLSRLGAASLGLETDHYARVFTRNFLAKRKGVPPVILSLAQGTADEDLDRLLDELRSGFDEESGKRILATRGGDISAATIGFNFNDMQLLSSREFGRDELDRVMGVPPAIWDKAATISNAEQAERRLLRQTIQPFLDYVAEEVEVQVIQRWYGEGEEVEADNVVPEDRKLVLDERKLYWFAKTLDEVRADQGLEPHPDPELGGRMFAEVAGRMNPGGPGFGVIPTVTLSEGLQAEDERDEEDESEDEQQVREELKNWQGIAVREMKAGRDPARRYFESDVIPVAVRQHIEAGLREAGSPEEVKAVFAAPFRELDKAGARLRSSALLWQGYP